MRMDARKCLNSIRNVRKNEVPVLQLGRFQNVGNTRFAREHDAQTQRMRQLWKTLHDLRVRGNSGAHGAEERWQAGTFRREQDNPRFAESLRKKTRNDGAD